jgi:two-component system response regulator PilR (NtrC family)
VGVRILVVDDEFGLREMLRVLLKRHGHEVDAVEGQSQAEARLTQGSSYDVVITDLSMPDGSGMGVLESARTCDDATQVIMITAYATTTQAVQAMREGAYDYIQKPFKNDELLAVIDKAIEKRAIVQHNRALRQRLKEGFRVGDVVGRSPAIQRVMALVQRVASAPSSVLLTGESGTGKELVARALHHSGDRASDPFVAVNCAALPEPLLESELFGHEKGAFTGADSRKEGLFRAAAGGTLFLDEVGELPLTLQVKLLRALQERRVRPVGGREEVPITCRVIAATNRDVELDVTEGRFREDLYYRLNVINLRLPPLRERPEDIPLLAEHFLAKHAALQSKRLAFSPGALRWIVAQPYRGNVRELENVIERAVTLAIGERVELVDLDPSAASTPPPPLPSIDLSQAGVDLDAYLADVERRALLDALEQTGGVRKRAARLLGMTFRSFRYRLAKYDLAEKDDLDAGDTGEDLTGS